MIRLTPHEGTATRVCSGDECADWDGDGGALEKYEKRRISLSASDFSHFENSSFKIPDVLCIRVYP
jgi:hypothetical protein